MKNLFYFETENLLCWVAGYTADGNSALVSKIAGSLIADGNKFADISGVSINEVCTEFITKSRRYKNMRVFYARVGQPPSGATKISSPWTMSRWLYD